MGTAALYCVLVLSTLFAAILYLYCCRRVMTPPKVFYDLSEFPKIEALHEDLLENYASIKHEIAGLDRLDVLDVKVGSGDIYFRPEKLKQQFGALNGWTVGYDITGTEWTQYPVIFQGKLLPNSRRSLPILTSLLEPLEGSFYVLFVSRLEPGGNIPLHSDGTEGKAIGGGKAGPLERLTYHFYVDCPPVSVMTVEGREVTQRDGEGLVFDSSREHSVSNRSDRHRTILCGKFFIN